MNQIMRYLLPLLSLIGAGTTALAQDHEASTGAVRYEVELIVFRHVDQSRTTPEMPAEGSQIRESPLTLNPADSVDEPFMNRLEAGAPESSGPALIMSRSGVAESAEREPRVSFFLMDPRADYPDFVPIDDSSFELDAVFQRLETLDAYRPLVHLGWIQTTRGAAEAIPYQISIRDRDLDDVTGSITLYRERYLHLELDLMLDPAVDEYGTGSDFYTRDIIEQMQATGRNRHKLSESRRIREPSSHYFDHPLFGVIARIEKIVVEMPSEADGEGRAPNTG
jgi:hypothetical protein